RRNPQSLLHRADQRSEQRGLLEVAFVSEEPDRIRSRVAAPTQVPVLARVDVGGDETVAGQQVPATTLLGRQHHPISVGIADHVVYLNAHNYRPASATR